MSSSKKRKTEVQLTRDSYEQQDDDEETEEVGTWKQAPPEELKKRRYTKFCMFRLTDCFIGFSKQEEV